MTATLQNWREPQHTAWGFQNVDQLIPTQPIKRSLTPFDLPTSEPHSFEGFTVRNLDFKSFLNYTSTDGFVLLHKGKIIHEYYANTNNVDSKHIIFSMTKSMTALVAGILNHQGTLDLTADVKKYIPEVSKLYDGVTVQQCLDMETGVKYEDGQHEYRAATAWEPLGSSDKYKTLHEFLQHVDAEMDEGKGFNYCSVNTDLLGWVIERATKRKLSQLISELLWEPMGASSDAFITVDSEGSPRAAGGMSATVRDLARVGQLLVDGGRDVVPKSWIEEMLNGGNIAKFAKGLWFGAFGAFEKPAYHNCWVTDPDTRRLVALGIHGQQLVVDLDHEIVMAKTSSQLTPVEFDKSVLGFEAMGEFRRLLAG
ncbi:hypothetical protein LTR62_005030 [Meristemomyces frigidus]|uniref:Beta-lactamase-related domain-containing protein n=1 Tax=Meristemomyces frigidus TaxID=1508187 RepID=A0AAN7TPK6_9PEZI|nr:hypothetical protein LTR62_005030 [Meristemomyces frigidus]